MRLIFTIAFLFIVPRIFGQNIGIGTSNPTEKLEVNGGIKIGNSTNAAKGTVRWNEVKNDFEGYNGTAWVSLTGGKGTWGDQENYMMENDGTHFLLFYNNGANGYYLGSSLATNDSFLLAGAPNDFSSNNGVSTAGSIRIFKKENGKFPLTPTINLASPSPTTGEHLGSSLSIDGNNFISGASGFSNSKGKAYVYRFDANGQPVYKGGFSHPELNTGDAFGKAVGISGNDALISAPYRTINGNSRQGKVYALKYNFINDSWGFTGSGFTAPDGIENDYFGTTISISGNFAAISAQYKKVNNAVNAGKVYIYVYDGSDWIYSNAITLNSPATSDNFGQSLFLKDDTLLVGAPQWAAFTGQDGKGKVMMYIRNGINWELSSVIEASDGKPGDAFGSSVYMKNGHIIIGAPHGSVGLQFNIGKSYIFRKVNNSWEQLSILRGSVTQQDRLYGNNVLLTDNTVIVSEEEATVLGNTSNGRLFFYYKR